MAYSQDYRQLALKRLEEGYSIRETAEYFEISTRTLQNWKKRPVRKARVFKPIKIDEARLLQDIKDNPSAYQYERAQLFGCTPAAICKALKRLGITQKKDSKSSES